MKRHPCRNITSAFKKPVMHDTCWARTCICTLFLTSIWQWPDMLHKWIEHEAHIVSFVSSHCAVCQLPWFVNVVSVICLPSKCGWTGLTKTGSSIRVCANDSTWMIFNNWQVKRALFLQWRSTTACPTWQNKMQDKKKSFSSGLLCPLALCAGYFKFTLYHLNTSVSFLYNLSCHFFISMHIAPCADSRIAAVSSSWHAFFWLHIFCFNNLLLYWLPQVWLKRNFKNLWKVPKRCCWGVNLF